MLAYVHICTGKPTYQNPDSITWESIMLSLLGINEKSKNLTVMGLSICSLRSLDLAGLSIYLSIYKRNKSYSIKEQPLETSHVFAYSIHGETVCSSIYGSTHSFTVYTIANKPLLYHIRPRCTIIPYDNILYHTIVLCYSTTMLLYFYITRLLFLQIVMGTIFWIYIAKSTDSREVS